MAFPGAEALLPPDIAFLEHDHAVVKGNAFGRPGELGRLQFALGVVGIKLVDQLRALVDERFSSFRPPADLELIAKKPYI
ncbi:hypothetical protein [Porphyrobacter sp. AAP60]|uniref:hypothetical protein n=1 Tax=Porphyrobacter sp. AAP60 TaxID=1523423 RepID=UPI0012E2DE93|nr:hypothetical protein [Porphyrobacter sp. AAP60]